MVLNVQGQLGAQPRQQNVSKPSILNKPRLAKGCSVLRAYQGSIRMAAHHKEGGVPLLGPPPKVTDVQKNELCHWINLLGPFLVHKFWVPDPHLLILP